MTPVATSVWVQIEIEDFRFRDQDGTRTPIDRPRLRTSYIYNRQAGAVRIVLKMRRV